MIKINKELERPDGGVVASGSIVRYSTNFSLEKSITYYIKHFVSVEDEEDGKLPIPSVEDFKYKLKRDCTDAEWLQLNDAGSAVLVEEWLKDLIEVQIGLGYIELV